MNTAVCFDLDDTLYPYAEYARAGLREAANRLTALTGQHLHNELADLYFEEGIRTDTFDRLLARHDELRSDLVEDLVAAYHNSSSALEPYPETESVLERLGEQHRLGLVTDGQNGHDKLDRLGLDSYFDAIVVNPNIGCTKHEREPFERALSTLAVPPARTVYVGDDPRVDFRVPNRLGMGTVRVRCGRYTHLDPDDERAAPDVEIDRLKELPSLLEEQQPN